MAVLTNWSRSRAKALRSLRSLASPYCFCTCALNIASWICCIGVPSVSRGGGSSMCCAAHFAATSLRSI